MSDVIANDEMKTNWITVCKATDVIYETGVAAIINNIPIAVYRLRNNKVYALGNVDPYCDAGVLARGLIGSIDGVPVVASPMYKQHFRLEDGVCVEEPQISVASYETIIIDGMVSVAMPVTS